MQQIDLEQALSGLPLGGVRYYDRLGSTNDEAAAWVEQRAPDLALVVADEQTSGRGRAGRAWYTLPGAALAFSLVLYPPQGEGYVPSRLTALGALAVKEALQEHYQLFAQIKWPNDVLLSRRKAAGILAEANWSGERLRAVVLGIGINVAPASVFPDAELNFPATSVEEALGRQVDRLELLRAVLVRLLGWRSRLGSPDFLRAWEASLAFRGEWVQIEAGEEPGASGIVLEGQVIGLAPDGSLRLRSRDGEEHRVRIGEVRLRPINSCPT